MVLAGIIYRSREFLARKTTDGQDIRRDTKGIAAAVHNRLCVGSPHNQGGGPTVMFGLV